MLTSTKDMALIRRIPVREAVFKTKKYPSMTGSDFYIFFSLFGIGIALAAFFWVWWFQLSHISQNFTGIFHIFDFILFFALSYIVWHQILMDIFSWYVASDVSHPNAPYAPPQNLRVAYVTAFVPGAEPYSVLEKSLTAMVAVDYPHETWLLDEGDDKTAKMICKDLGVKHFSRKDKIKYNTDSGKFQSKTKGGNYNAWLHTYDTKYDIVAQHDVDFIPCVDFLTRTLGYFRDPEVAFVGLPQVYGNETESWIARGAAEQTYGFYGPLQKGLYGHDMTLLVGANHIMRMKAYKDIDGYTAHITEDLLTGMKLYTHENNWKSVYVPEILLVGEGPGTWASYLGQQMRWAYGCMDIFFRHSPDLLPKMSLKHFMNYFILQQFYFSGVAQVAGVALLTLYFFTGITPSNMALLPIFILYVPLFLYQIAFHLWLQRFNIDPSKEKGLMIRGRILSIAAWPVYFLAFIGVIRGKRLTYVVTPKGDLQLPDYRPKLFLPHFIIGSATLLGMIVGYVLGHTAGPMYFWAIINTSLMYFFFLSEAIPYTIVNLQRFAFGLFQKEVSA